MKTLASFIRKTFSLALLLLGMVLLQDGCSTNPHTGTISIHSPQVDTRERLINRRLEEQAWLEKQLTSDASFSLQGSIDTREFVGVAAAIKGTFDPLGGAQTGSAMQTVANNARVSDLMNQYAVDYWKKQIEGLNSTNTTANSGVASNSVSPTAAGTNFLTSVSAVVNMGPFASNSVPLPNPANRNQSGASLTAIQTLDDQLAKRNYIQSLLREQELDDTHDLGGKTLYTLKLDVDINPGVNNPSFGQVSIDLAGPGALPTIADFRSWVRALRRELLEESLGQQRRYYMDYLTDDERDQLFALALQAKAEKVLKIGNDENSANKIYQNDLKTMGAGVDAKVQSLGQLDGVMNKSAAGHNLEAQAYLKGLNEQRNFLNALENFNNAPSGETAEKVLALPSSPGVFKDLKKGVEQWRWLDDLAAELNSGNRGTNGNAARALCYLVAQRYQAALDGMAVIQQSDVGSGVQSNLFFVCTASITNEDAAYQNFTNRLAAKNSGYVTSVEPREYAQNISDVAARERMISLAATLSAIIPQINTSLGLDSSYVKHTQQIFDTIKRQPLVVGYASGMTNFGWILGPKFDIQNGDLAWSQTPAHYPVEANIVVPGWWRQINLNVKNSWLTDKAEPDYPAGHYSIPVDDLPGDYAAITRTLFALAGQEDLKPSIQPRWDSDPSRRKIVVREDQSLNVLIRGSDLWRNPSVFIGSQAADQIKVLPDMAGLWAHFSNVPIPGSAIPGPQLADLSVITSGGISILRDGVQILPAAKNALLPFAKLESTYLTNGGNLTFTLDANLLPKSYGQLTLLLTDPRTSAANLYYIQTNFLAAGVWTWPVPSNLVSGDSRELGVDLKIGQTPDPKETLVSVLDKAPGRIIFFASPSNVQLQLNPVTVNFSTNTTANSTNLIFVLQTTKALFNGAFPEFETALAGGKASLTLTNAVDKTSTNIQLGGSLDSIQAPLSLTKPAGTNTAQIWSLWVNYPATKNGAGSLPVNTNLTVNWGK